VVALLGWQFRLDALKGFPGQLQVVAPNTALCMILSSIATLLLREKSSTRARRIGTVLATLVLIFAAATLTEYLSGINLHIDSLFFSHRMADWPVPTVPGRFAIQSAVAFTLIASALLLVDRKIERYYISEFFVAAGILPPAIATVGYIYGAAPLHGVMSSATILLFWILWTGVLLLRPQQGAIALFLSSGSGGLTARQLVSATTMVVVAGGWIYLHMRQAGLVDREYGIAVLVIAMISTVTLLILSTAAKLERIDRERDFANERVARTLREKQATERRLNEGLEAANAATWDYDMRTGELYWSRGHFLLMGYKIGEVKPSMDAWRQRIHPDDVERVSTLYSQCLWNKTPFNTEYRVVWPDGSVHWLETKGKLILDEIGEPVRSIGGFIEITDRKQTQQALLDAEKLAVTGRMAATLAHEINNPLAAVTNLIYLLKSDNNVNSATAKQFLQVADDEIRRVAQLVQKTLSFYRSDAQASKVALSELLDDVVWLYMRRIQENGIKIEKRIDFAGQVISNGAELRQVFTNLFVNALDAVGQGGRIVIHVAPARSWKNGCDPGVRVTISDNGPGIPVPQRAQLFTPFFSMKGDRGTGLGLWISKSIMEKHGGYIRFRSCTSSPSGTVFSVFVPNRVGEVRGTEQTAATA
jgi:PAS domain S-box-containing protein